MLMYKTVLCCNTNLRLIPSRLFSELSSLLLNSLPWSDTMKADSQENLSEEVNQNSGVNTQMKPNIIQEFVKT